ncbi:hypothetical protein J4443_02345 [Candidatus Woesearchaeota archaeon]|nr:hypothetical protein [Candidatus Woesearchaeota archaeon]
MKRQDIITNSIGIFVSLIGVIVGSFFGEKSTIGILILIGIFLLVIIFFLISWRVDVSSQRDKKVIENSRDIKMLQKDLNSFKDTINIIRDISDLKSRMSNLEKMKLNKKGIIDPRIVVIVLIIILIYLFLREQGVI